MSPLGEEIRRLIERHGPISIAEYMALCLSHPVHGYYQVREPFGRTGDFITAPEITQIFGELLGLWVAGTWLEMGAPSPVRLIEIGPGRGTLMADALRAMRVIPGLLEAATLHLVETSPRLRRTQAETLAAVRPAPVWYDRIEDVPEGSAIVLANELFDALPVRQFVKTENGWRERVVGLRDGDLAFGLASDSVLPPFGSAEADAAPAGATWEVSPAAQALARGLAERLTAGRGAALVIDYGRMRPGPDATFQAVRGHAPADPLAEPGLADLTAHVDFEALGAAAEAGGATVFAPLDQGEFLNRLGISVRADRLKQGAAPSEAAAIDAAVTRLTNPSEMGTLFKAFAFAGPGLALPGFDPAPPKRDQDLNHA